MKTTLISFIVCLAMTSAYAQHSFTGIQNSPRKGMIHASMNPAEINHLHRKVEFNLFAFGGTLSNNTLSFRDLASGDDLLDQVLSRVKGPVNLSAEAHVLGPSLGFSVNKWSFGIISQAFVKGDILDLDSDLGRAFVDGSLLLDLRKIQINSAANQRATVSGWGELGFLAGREIWADQNHVISGGVSLKLLIPAVYVNMGLNRLQGTLTQSREEFTLSGANGQLSMSYPNELDDWDFEKQLRERFSPGNISGFAMDLGVTHQYKINGRVLFNSGLSLKNLGGMNVGTQQVNNTFSIQIPEEEAFRLDLLDGNIREVEDQLLNSGYFSLSSRTGKTRVALPSLLTAYTEMHVSRIFQVSVSGQFRMADDSNNEHLTTQNVFAVTPRLSLGIFEVYSPWAHYEVSGLTGGLGLRIGGFFIGSQSVVTGLLADTHQADLHVGFSMGFGKH